jgi:hypothetical protein
MRFAREGDEIICTRIDRCARSMADFQRIVTEWRKQGIGFRAVDQAGVVLDGSPHSDLFLNLLMAFAEFEARLRRERQMDGVKTKEGGGQGQAEEPADLPGASSNYRRQQSSRPQGRGGDRSIRNREASRYWSSLCLQAPFWIRARRDQGWNPAMKWENITVEYRYRRNPSGAWTNSRWAGMVRERLESLVVQRLREQRPGYEVELLRLHWR